MSYEETEKSYEGDDLNIYISRTEAIDIIVETGGKEKDSEQT